MKKISWTCLFLFLLLSTGCRPDGVIPPADMEKLFCAFYEADACIEVLSETGTPVDHPDSLRVYLPVIEQMGYTKEDFRVSMDYYLHHPDRLNDLFQRVGKRMARERGGLQTTEEVEEEAPVDPKTIREGAEAAAEEIREGVPAPEKKDRKRLSRRAAKQTEVELQIEEVH